MSRNFGAIIIGDEILSGKRQDKHFAKIAEMLGARGLRLSWVEYLGDDRERLAATFRRSHGRPRVMRETKPILSSRASFSSNPQAVSIPAARNFASPLPATSGFGSLIAATTRETPAASKASAHGGVRPKWLHGSSVT